MVGFKVRQTEFIIAIAQIYSRKVVGRKDATLTDERKYSNVWMNTELKECDFIS